jgi:ABC-type nitrate/sulfonate/bicarbonate transport system substrate-binding protein
MPVQPRSALLTALGAGVASATIPRLVRAQAIRVRVAAPFSDTFGAPFWAKDAGAFARAGFDLEVTSLANAGAVAAALAGGAVDLGIGDFVSSTNAIQKGLPIQLIAGCGLYRSNDPNSFICVPKGSAIQRPRDLEGKSCSAPTLVGLTTASIKAWLTQNGTDPEKVRIVELTSSSAPAAVLRGTVDAGLLAEPNYTPVKDQFRDIGHPFDAISKEFLVSAWFANRNWVEADRPRAKKVIAAIYDTQRWANTHHAETLAIFAETTKIDIESLRPMSRTLYATQLIPSYVQPVLNTAEKFKLIEKNLDATSMFPKL